MSANLGDVFRHHLWANLRLIDFCAGLTEDDLLATAPSTYGAVRDTLQHLLSSEGRYVATFPADWRGDLNEDQEFPGMAALHDHAVDSGEALINLAESTPDSQRLKGVHRDQPFDIPASTMFSQAINHATEHRLHVVSILDQRGIKAPRLDAIAYQIALTNG
jgi:uncharacterized damage-inducible protein DinB